MELLQDFLFGADGSRFTMLAEAIQYLVAGPGNVILDLFGLVSPAPSDESYLQRQVSWAMPLGIAFWIVVLLVIYAMRRPRAAKSGDAGLGAVAPGALRPIARRVSSLWQSIRGKWTVRDMWGAAWRAEVVHLALYVGIPLSLETLRVIVFFLFLPLTVLGVGNKGPFFAGTLDHIASPVCWTFVSWCKSPSAEFRDLSPAEEALCRAGRCPPPSSRMVDPFGWVWKLAWAAISLTWIGLWRRRQRNAQLPPAS
jgi:hypothetical protein